MDGRHLQPSLIFVGTARISTKFLFSISYHKETEGQTNGEAEKQNINRGKRKYINTEKIETEKHRYR